MPQYVEDVGGEWFASVLGKWCRLAQTATGERIFGNRRLVWTLAPADAVAVSHPGANGAAEPLAYLVRIDPVRVPSGGRRWYWLCPACSRRADVLYLPAGRDRLACRRCCGLLYRSQFRRGKAKQRKGRPVVITTGYRWEWDARERRMRLAYRRDPELWEPTGSRQQLATK